VAELRLPEQPSQVSLGAGHSLFTAGLQGTARVDSGGRAIGGDAVAAALQQAGLRPGIEVALPPAAPAGARALTETASPGPSQVALDVDVPAGQSCLLLVEDIDTGALTWIVPDAPAIVAAKGEGARGLSGPSRRFTVPLAPVATAPGARDLVSLSDAGKKLQTFFFDAVDPILGPIVHGYAKKWEALHRPAFVRRLGPDDYTVDDPSFPRLADAEWQSLAGGPGLLFVHGTFSTTAAFRGLDPATMAELSRSYGGRTFAYNHPTLTADPRENAIAFLGAVPSGVSLDVDIVCHSRGGLVARHIATLGAAAGKVRVRRIVFVGAVNAGTALADDAHMVDMVSRYTTIAKFLPEGPARQAVDALALVLKVAAHSLLHDLEGLAAMNPRGVFMQAMNVPGGTSPDYYAIASDFEPKPGTPFISVRRAEDLAADDVFGQAPNDLVVPRDGVFGRNGAAGFPISDARCLRFEPADGVIHTEFFVQPRTAAALLEWLAPAQPAARGMAPALAQDELARMFDTMRDQVLAGLARRMEPASRGVRERAFTPDELERLRPHVVNLSEGVFRQSGVYSTTPADVDAIVREHIPRWAAALPAGEPLRVVVYAHGGLVGERDGLRIAAKHVDWWKRNGVYPLYFVWETGLFDALRSILESVSRKLPGLGARDLFDYTTDPLVERGARALGGEHIWAAMKRYAELASAANGGATYVAARLQELSAATGALAGRELHLHAVGHSAGSIFHAWFLPAARQAKVPPFRTLQLLAPAITIAEFARRLAPALGPQAYVQQAVMYTMKKHYEEADDCIGIYRKSLLYLIHHALEPRDRTPILGLELSLRADAPAATLFGLNGAGNAPGRVVWSVTDATQGRDASASTSHGGFDDDPATMNSVAANVLDEPQARVAYTGEAGRALHDWPQSNDWLAGVDLTGGFGMPLPAAAAPATPLAPARMPARMPPAVRPAASSGGGARRALCVGIDAYPAPNTLSGCVNDTDAWKKTLEAQAFDVKALLDKEATRETIVARLGELVDGARSGDVLVFQYSGHGTRVPDLDGDEDDGSDEALVPYDFKDGSFLIDDDVRAVFERLPDGVNLTCFIDCCHSGTITRMLGRNAGADDTSRPRYLQRTEAWEDWMRAHARFRERERTLRLNGGGASRAFGANQLRWVTFSACDATEVAYENQGNGDFTRRATALLAAPATQRSNRDFQDAVIAAFGERRRQTPQLDCADAARDLGLLLPLR
jgi:hypothetical protein